MKTAGIIGGSNLIGNYIILKFLAEDYRVKVQVSKKEKIKNDSVFKRISVNRNLEVCPVELTNSKQISNFIKDCEVVIHCGQPFYLDTTSTEIPIFVPIIQNTHNLFNAIQHNTSLRKVIFITSTIAAGSEHTSTQHKKVQQKNSTIEKARFHAEKAVSNILDNYPEDFFEIVCISPVEVKDEVLSNSSSSTSSGLQFLFRKKMTQDMYFDKLLKRQVFDRLITINELPERIFQAAT